MCCKCCNFTAAVNHVLLSDVPAHRVEMDVQCCYLLMCENLAMSTGRPVADQSNVALATLVNSSPQIH